MRIFLAEKNIFGEFSKWLFPFLKFSSIRRALLPLFLWDKWWRTTRIWKAEGNTGMSLLEKRIWSSVVRRKKSRLKGLILESSYSNGIYSSKRYPRKPKFSALKMETKGKKVYQKVEQLWEKEMNGAKWNEKKTWKKNRSKIRAPKKNFLIILMVRDFERIPLPLFHSLS